MFIFRKFPIAIALLAALPAFAQHGHDGKHESPKPGRTIEISMADTMRFTPSAIEVKRGETVRFVVSNTGKLPHEMVIGTRRELEEHAAAMAKSPHAGAHDKPGMVNVAPGGKGEFTYQFKKAGDLEFGCLVPGHFPAGMVGQIKVKP